MDWSCRFFGSCLGICLSGYMFFLLFFINKLNYHSGIIIQIIGKLQGFGKNRTYKKHCTSRNQQGERRNGEIGELTLIQDKNRPI